MTPPPDPAPAPGPTPAPTPSPNPTEPVDPVAPGGNTENSDTFSGKLTGVS